MALLDAYVTAEEYEGVSTKGRTINDSSLEVDLKVGSRLVDHVLGVSPGAFNSDEGTRYFSGNGKQRLYLADADGQHFLQAVDSVAIDGTDYPIDADAPWVVGHPRNAAVFGKPYDALHIADGARWSAWPSGTFNVAVAGTWGWASVPDGIKTLVIAAVRDIRDRQSAGALMQVEVAGTTTPIARSLYYRIRELRSEYAYRGPRVA